VWQAVSEAQGRGRGDEPLAILFTDLVGFSDWALHAGDDAALELLRTVGRTVDPVIKDRNDSDVDLRRRWRFKAKGTPSDLKVFSAKLEP
jgi:hypothetical protein